MTPTEAAQLVKRADRDRELRVLARRVARRLIAIDRSLEAHQRATRA